ncbi:hypothetical protein MUCCIDRAFT_138363 [Mucor lusitanicus CBS 277.49]|uniref:RING-type domain-containing protein n=1 Tax=Mucor lusitanicus CBS 277.49 TaxID=747725 RepID=A0A168NBP9_MUCCL|nr:hypothetical protein MUCCIDRAFT_138363 [Mucor lusitanicus CBS 277.49]
MKFGKQLETEAEGIPSEWRPYLIQYKALKKLITKVAEEIESRGLSTSLLHECLEEDGGLSTVNDEEDESIPKIKYYFTAATAADDDASANDKGADQHDETTLDDHEQHQQEERILIKSPAVKRQRRSSTVTLVKELLTLTLEEKDRIKDAEEKEDQETKEVQEKHEKHIKTLVVELEQDDEFFKMLMEELQQAAMLQDVTTQKFQHDISDLETRMTKVAAPTQKTDMYNWRKIFSIYMDAQIFQGNAESDRTFRSVERAKKQMTWFVEQLGKSNLLNKLKSKESKSAFEQFVALNTELITMKHYQMLNQTAMRKILKKHDKRSGLTASQSFPEIVSTDALFSPKLAKMLYSTITTKLTTIIPQPEDYACPVCMSVAWRPIRLACSHVFCVRCLIKAQKKKMDSCPLCRHPTAVRSATALNLDEGLQNFLKLYFPQEIKEKKRENEREQAIEDVQAMTGKKYTEEQLMRMSQNRSDSKCNIM